MLCVSYSIQNSRESECFVAFRAIFDAYHILTKTSLLKAFMSLLFGPA